MKDLNEFREKILNNKELSEKFKNVKNRDEFIKIAKKNNYNFTKQELASKDIEEEMLDTVAGGKNSTTVSHTEVIPDNTIVFNGTKEDAELVKYLIETSDQ